MAGVKIVDLPALGRDLINTDLLEVSLNGGGSRKITGQEIMNASKLAIGSTPIVSGTVGRLLFQGAGNVLSQPSSLFYDAVNNRLGIGTTTPGASLDVVYESTFQSRIDMYGTLYMYNNITSLSGNIWLNDGYAIGDWGTGNNRIEFYNNRMSFFGNGNEALRIVGSTQNVLIGTTTDAGFKFNVNGTARVQGNTSVSLNQNAGTNLTISNTNSGSSAEAFLRVTASNGSFSFSKVSSSYPTYKQIVANDSSIYNGTIGDISIFNDFATGRIKFGAGGSSTAQMILDSTGNVGIGTSSPTQALDIFSGNLTLRSSSSPSINIGTGGFPTLRLNNRTAIQEEGSTIMSIGRAYSAVLFFSSNTEVARFNGGNLLINTTTDAGFRLDVNGTARVSASDGVSAFQITAPTRAWYFTTSLAGGTFNAISGAANGAAGTGNFGFVLSGGWGFHIGQTTSQSNSFLSVYASGTNNGELILGGQTSVASSLLTMNSTTKGFLPPRMTNAQRAAIASPAVGLIVYCTDATEGLYVYKSTGWTFMV